MAFGGNYLSSENGMQGQNWFDALLHGLPWILLLSSILLNIFGLLTIKDSQYVFVNKPVTINYNSDLIKKKKNSNYKF
jgi:hypothetical protein